jgi:hypothetical protein
LPLLQAVSISNSAYPLTVKLGNPWIFYKISCELLYCPYIPHLIPIFLLHTPVSEHILSHTHFIKASLLIKWLSTVSTDWLPCNTFLIFCLFHLWNFKGYS